MFPPDNLVSAGVAHFALHGGGAQPGVGEAVQRRRPSSRPTRRPGGPRGDDHPATRQDAQQVGRAWSTQWHAGGDDHPLAGQGLNLGLKDVAALAGVSVTWYTWLEQGRDINPSQSVLSSIAETLRMVLGWAWTYVIVAELIGASSGIGHMITDSQALLATDQIIFGIIVIGLIGLLSDLLFKAANRLLFPWASLR